MSVVNQLKAAIESVGFKLNEEVFASASPSKNAQSDKATAIKELSVLAKEGEDFKASGNGIDILNRDLVRNDAVLACLKKYGFDVEEK